MKRFKEKNPGGKVPIMKLNEDYIPESVDIIYAIDKAANNSKWTSEDTKHRVSEVLKHCDPLGGAKRAIFQILTNGSTKVQNEQIPRIFNSLKVFEEIRAGKPFLLGDSISVADFLGSFLLE